MPPDLAVARQPQITDRHLIAGAATSTTGVAAVPSGPPGTFTRRRGSPLSTGPPPALQGTSPLLGVGGAADSRTLYVRCGRPEARRRGLVVTASRLRLAGTGAAIFQAAPQNWGLIISGCGGEVLRAGAFTTGGSTKALTDRTPRHVRPRGSPAAWQESPAPSGVGVRVLGDTAGRPTAVGGAATARTSMLQAAVVSTVDLVRRGGHASALLRSAGARFQDLPADGSPDQSPACGVDARRRSARFDSPGGHRPAAYFV